MQSNILNTIKSPNDLKSLNNTELEALCVEIREALVTSVAQNGGHLSSNLGVVELTVALHKEFDSPNDTFIFDVGHQCYTHKMLTGRYKDFSTLRKEDGLSGFPKPKESAHDPFISGHASTSVSLATGVATANKLLGNNYFSIAILGDGALSGGLVYEAFNNINKDMNLIVILNDNEMSISSNVGSMSKYISKIRFKKQYQKLKNNTENRILAIPKIGRFFRNILFWFKQIIKHVIYNSTIFEDMGFYYLGPVDGNDLEKCIAILQTAKVANKPVLIHTKTVKGKGYKYAEDDPSHFHGVSPFDVDNVDITISKDGFSHIFGSVLCELAEKNNSICAITAAMGCNTGLDEFSKLYPQRYFDVGIAESHAITFSAGLAKQNFIPVFAVYSTFLQRSYDQIIHDGALQERKMIIAIDRAGFVGDDGETHQGLFDVAFLNSIENVTIYSPTNYKDLEIAMTRAVNEDENIIAVRYPKGKETELDDYVPESSDYTILGHKEAKVAVITYGKLFENVQKAVKSLTNNNIEVKIIKLNKIKPVNLNVLEEIRYCSDVFFYEESVAIGSIAQYFSMLITQNKIPSNYYIKAVDNAFTKAMSVDKAYLVNGFDEKSIADNIMEKCSAE